MRSLSVRFGLSFVLTLWIACSQEPVSDSDALGAGPGPGAGAAAAGSSAGSAAGAIAGSAAVGGGASGGGGRSAIAGPGSVAGARGIAGSGGASVAGASGASAAGANAAGRGAAGAAAGGESGSAGASAAAGAGASGGAAGAGSASHAPCPVSGACKILPLGDSITYGIGYSGGYRVELFRRARADGKTITFTGSVMNGPMMVDGVAFPRNNEGHSGWKIAQLSPLIPMPALTDPPHIVLLMIGTNDIAQNDDLGAAPMRLGALIDKLVMNAPDALIVVAQVTPLGRSSNTVQTYNAAIPALVQERSAAGKHVILVDQFTGFPTAELGDGVHPNQQGYERMAGVWYDAIGRLLR